MLMNPGALIQYAAAQGIELRAFKGKLQARMAAGVSVPVLWREVIKRHRREILEYLETEALFQTFGASVETRSLCMMS